VRLGTSAGTTRGFGETEFRRIGSLILEVLKGLRANPAGDAAVEQRVRGEVAMLCKEFPIY